MPSEHDYRRWSGGKNYGTAEEIERRRNEEQLERRLQQEATTIHLGTLGVGANVAKVEVSWVESDGTERAGYWIAKATGDEPVETIYDTFDGLVTDAMDRRHIDRGWETWQIDDTYAA